MEGLSDELREEVSTLEEQLGERTAETWKLGTRGDEAEERVKKLEEALRFYAEDENWKVQRYEHAGVNAVRNRDGSWAGLPVMHDNGDRARQALAKENERGE